MTAALFIPPPKIWSSFKQDPCRKKEVSYFLIIKAEFPPENLDQQW